MSAASESQAQAQAQAAVVASHLSDSLRPLLASLIPMVKTILAFAGPSAIRAVIQGLTPAIRSIPAEYRAEIDQDLHVALTGDLQPGSLAE